MRREQSSSATSALSSMVVASEDAAAARAGARRRVTGAGLPGRGLDVGGAESEEFAGLKSVLKPGDNGLLVSCAPKGQS
jgi:hypothetical protein